MLAYTETNSQLAEELITEAFCSSLGGELESKVRDREPTNLTDAYRYAVRIESRQPQLKQFNSSRKKNDDQCAFAINIVSDGEETGSHLRVCHSDSQSARLNALEIQIDQLNEENWRSRDSPTKIREEEDLISVSVATTVVNTDTSTDNVLYQYSSNCSVFGGVSTYRINATSVWLNDNESR